MDLGIQLSVAAEHISLQIPTADDFLLDEKDVHLTGLLCPIHLLKVNKVHADENFIESFTSRILSICIWSLVETYVLVEEPASI